MYDALKKQIQVYAGKDNVFVTGNGTSAIYLALKASQVPIGSKIAVPNIACPDPVYALIWAGYKPVFIDVNKDDYNMDTNRLEAKLSEDKTIRGIIAIHLFGNACDIVSIARLAKEYDCFLLEDAAQAFGNEIDEGKLGSFGDVSIFSFGNGKIVEAGHGGSVHTDDDQLMSRIRIEYKKLNEFDDSKVAILGKAHRNIYYKLYNLGLKFPVVNILNILYVYFFKNYYLYKLDGNRAGQIVEKIANFENEKNKRERMVDIYRKDMPEYATVPKLNNKRNILSRLTVQIEKAELISKKIRDNDIPSNTMYPMLVDRFHLVFKKDEYNNSYDLKGRLLNLWTNDISSDDLVKTINIIKEQHV